MAYETRTTTIGEILLLHPSTEGNKAWVDGFQATVRNSKAIKARNGSVFYTGQFCDPQDERYQIKGTCNIDITRFEGMMVDVGGQGISKESYKGADEIKIGQKATIVPVANQQQQLPVQSAPPPPPPQQHYQQPPPPQPVQSSQAPARKPFGPAIGNCIALAVKCVLERSEANPGTPEFQRQVYEIASDLLRLNEHMEIGHLAKSAKVRAAGVEELVPEGFAQSPPPAPVPVPPPAPPPLHAHPPRQSTQPGPQPAFQESEMIGEEEDSIPF